MSVRAALCSAVILLSLPARAETPTEWIDLGARVHGAFGAFIGAALIEVIRNSLLMAGVDSNWQGLFVGVVIVFAVLLNRIRGSRGD